VQYQSYKAAAAAFGVGDPWSGAPEVLSAGAGVPLLPGPVTVIEAEGGTDGSQAFSKGGHKLGDHRLRGDKNPLVVPHLQAGKYVVGGVDIGTDLNKLEDVATGELWY
jgi:hypothetical protein